MRVRIVKVARRVLMVTICLALMFEADGPDFDPWAQLGWRFQADLSGWIGVHIIFSLFEICLVAAIVLWFLRDQKAKRTSRFQRGILLTPVLVFAGALAFGIANGLFRGGGNLTIALWEVRGFLILIAAYMVVGMFIHTDEHVNQLVWVIFIAATVLAGENILRWLIFKDAILSDDTAYDHTDSIILVCAMLIGISVLTYGGTRAQRRYMWLLLPLCSFCLLIMKRRAAFPVLAIGLVVLVIFLLRLRPRIFWRVVPPIAVVTAAYLAIFWNNSGTLGQPARAISSQFNPDPRDFASNLYRMIEKADILANIQQAPITGLGFGQQFAMVYPLPNLSFWPFWHYTTHNAILWVWMKGGVIGFLAFFWLLGCAAFYGARVVETQREEWALVAFLRKRFSRRGSRHANGDARQYAHLMLRPATRDSKKSVTRKRAAASQAVGLNVPAWERSDDKTSATAYRSGTLAILVVAVCMIPVQVMFSYVDLGLTSERTMLLFGLMLGLIGRGYMLLGVQPAEERQRGEWRQTGNGTGPAPSQAGGETKELVRLLTGGPTSGEEAQPQSRPSAGQARRAATRQTQPASTSSRGSKWQSAVRSSAESSGDDTPTVGYDELLPWEIPGKTLD